MGEDTKAVAFPESLEGPIMKKKEKEGIEDTGRQSDARRTPVEVAKPKGLNARIRTKGYSICSGRLAQ